uniref:Uncharacterized protein n=1 Tax=Arundo donax TaxID=35708 RepID=A0A0A9D4X2_ARUDO
MIHATSNRRFKKVTIKEEFCIMPRQKRVSQTPAKCQTNPFLIIIIVLPLDLSFFLPTMPALPPQPHLPCFIAGTPFPLSSLLWSPSTHNHKGKWHAAQWSCSGAGRDARLQHQLHDSTCSTTRARFISTCFGMPTLVKIQCPRVRSES